MTCLQSGATQPEKRVLQLMQQAASSVLQLSKLLALSATHRDLSVTLEQLHKKGTLGIANPLVHSSGGSEVPGKDSEKKLKYPMFDVTKLPDQPDSGLALQEKYMDKMSCWQQLLPPHLEVSYQTGTGIVLHPPQQAMYPSYIDFDAAIRGLQPHVHKVRSRRFKFSKHRRTSFVSTKQSIRVQRSSRTKWWSQPQPT